MELLILRKATSSGLSAPWMGSKKHSSPCGASVVPHGFDEPRSTADTKRFVLISTEKAAKSEKPVMIMSGSGTVFWQKRGEASLEYTMHSWLWIDQALSVNKASAQPKYANDGRPAWFCFLLMCSLFAVIMHHVHHPLGSPSFRWATPILSHCRELSSILYWNSSDVSCFETTWFSILLLSSSQLLPQSSPIQIPA